MQLVLDRFHRVVQTTLCSHAIIDRQPHEHPTVLFSHASLGALHDGITLPKGPSITASAALNS